MTGYGSNGQYTPASGLEAPTVFKVKSPEMPVKRRALGLGMGKTPRRSFSSPRASEALRVKEA